MKLRNIASLTLATVGIGTPVFFGVREEIPMPLAWYNPILAKYDNNSDQILSTEEAFHLIRSEIDKDKDGSLSKEEYEASKKVFSSGFLPPPKNVMESIRNYNNAIQIKIATDFLNHRLEEENKKQWVPVETI